LSIWRSQAEAQRVFRLAGWILKQEPAKMIFHCLRSSSGLRSNEAGNLGEIVLRESDNVGTRSREMDWAGGGLGCDIHGAASW
jgi:hypothetical protein